MSRDVPSTEARSGHAVVIGASMAGLLAARVLSEHFERVTVVDRDALPADLETDLESGPESSPEPRKGVPQGRHLHALLARGDQVLEGLFPGLSSELEAAGASRLDFPGDVLWFQEGGHKVRFASGIPIVFLSRPLLESRVRRRVVARGNVSLRGERDVAGLVASPDRTRVTGVRLRSPGEAAGGAVGMEEPLAADLVVDTSGRGSRSPRWLADLGYAPPEESVLRIDVGYTTRVYRRQDELLPGARGILTPPAPPGNRRAGGLFPIEDGRWIVTLAGWLGERAPADDAGFLAFARGLPCRDIYDVLCRAEPLSDFVTHHLPSNLRRHYERLARFPAGYLVMGDAMCSFNPIYGQGMSVAAMEADALARCLRERSDGRALARTFFKRAARALEGAWTLAAGEDFRFPEVEGPKPLATDWINRYVSRLHRTTFVDRETTRAFYRVMTLTHPPHSLFYPAILWRVLKPLGRSG